MLFNSTNCHIAVNGFWLNDASSISYQQQAQHEPLWGYMDRRFRTLAESTGLVAGTIGIYFHEHDKFFRYLSSLQGVPGQEGQSYETMRKQVREAIASQEDVTDLIGFVSALDLDSEEFAQVADVAFDISGLENPDPVDPAPNNENRWPDSDVVGESGFRATQRFDNTDQRGNRIPGARLDIYYGDSEAEREIETLIGVHIVGRAKSPIENRSGVGAEPVMEFYSFLASHVENARGTEIGPITGE